MGEEQIKCSYTRWAWFSLHLRDECICARDVTSPIAYSLHRQLPARQCHPGQLQNDSCERYQLAATIWRHVTQESRERSIRLRGVTGKKTL